MRKERKGEEKKGKKSKPVINAMHNFMTALVSHSVDCQVYHSDPAKRQCQNSLDSQQAVEWTRAAGCYLLRAVPCCDPSERPAQRHCERR